MTTLDIIKKDKAWTTGLFFLAATLLTFVCFGLHDSDDQFTVFVFNYCFTVGYLIVLLACRQRAPDRDRLSAAMLLLLLALVSAYSLNRTMGLFSPSTTWWSILLVTCCCNVIILRFFTIMPFWARFLTTLLLGLCFLCFTYLALYLLPTSLFGILFSPFFGFSLHALVPLVFLFCIIRFLRRITKQDRRLYVPFFAGIALPLLFVTLFTLSWASLIHRIDQPYQANKVITVSDQVSNPVTHDGQLPPWLIAARDCPKSPLSEMILKSGIIYDDYLGADLLFNGHFHWRTDAAPLHDPLVLIAQFFGGKTDIPDEDKMRILQTLCDSRYENQDRLWSGEDLKTTSVNTSVELYPSLRLAYTEKKITVANTLNSESRWNNQEAIYVFHLPEGAVISSLSLWINGEENKAVLTTTGKADSAYKTIVGREAHDPSVVHWQEGNRVTVRVFPVEPGKTRSFKIGISSPLALRDKQLVYQNAWFDGPSGDKARESIRITSFDKLQYASSPDFLTPDTKTSAGLYGSLGYQGSYRPDWALHIADQGIVATPFSFDGKKYFLEPASFKTESADIQTLYLDIDRSWTREEFQQIMHWAGSRKVFAADGEARLVQVTPQNGDMLFTRLSAANFAIFPIYAIDDPQRSLLISKSTGASPTMKDLEGTEFRTSLQDCLAPGFSRLPGRRINFFPLGPDLSPYLRTLMEFGALRPIQGSPAQLREILDHNMITYAIADDREVQVPAAGLLIRRADATTRDSIDAARQPYPIPDHLMRLFAYNHIMQTWGTILPGTSIIDQRKSPLTPVSLRNPVQPRRKGQHDHDPKDNVPDDNALQTAIREVGLAHIVTPISSMIVLEKKEDYQRFNIHDDGSGLQNASLKAKGAAPEPGEWALIILAAAVLSYVYLTRNAKKFKSAR